MAALAPPPPPVCAKAGGVAESAANKVVGMPPSLSPVLLEGESTEANFSRIHFQMRQLTTSLQQLSTTYAANQLALSQLQHATMATHHRMNELQNLLLQNREEIRWLAMAVAPTPPPTSRPPSCGAESSSPPQHQQQQQQQQNAPTPHHPLPLPVHVESRVSQPMVKAAVTMALASPVSFPPLPTRAAASTAAPPGLAVAEGAPSAEACSATAQVR